MKKSVIILMLITLALVTGCKQLSVIAPEVHTRDSVRVVYQKQRDSVYVERWHEKETKGDTVYVKDKEVKTEYRDRELHDTVQVVTHDSVPYPVEVPTPYVPRAARVQIAGFWLLLVLIIASVCVYVYAKNRGGAFSGVLRALKFFFK